MFLTKRWMAFILAMVLIFTNCNTISATDTTGTVFVNVTKNGLEGFSFKKAQSDKYGLLESDATTLWLQSDSSENTLRYSTGIKPEVPTIIHMELAWETGNGTDNKAGFTLSGRYTDSAGETSGAKNIIRVTTDGAIEIKNSSNDWIAFSNIDTKDQTYTEVDLAINWQTCTAEIYVNGEVVSGMEAVSLVSDLKNGITKRFDITAATDVTGKMLIKDFCVYEGTKLREINVAKIDSAYYESLAEAITAANAIISSNPDATVEIDLQADVTSSDITIVSGITLDLNGNTLTASSLATFKGNVVDGSSDKSGLLIVGKNDDGTPKCSFSTTNTQMPVYDTEKGGYAFADIEKQEDHNIVNEDNSTVFKLFFKPSFGTTINTLLANGSKDAHVNVIIRLTYNGDTYDLTYNNEMVKAVYGKDNMAFYINASGVEKFEGLIITPMVVSDDLKVEWSGTSFSDFTINN